MWWIGFHAVLFWFLFADFYKHTYGRKRAKAAVNGKSQLQNGEAKMNGINGYCNGNGVYKTNGVTNGAANGHGKPQENGYKNGVVTTNGHANGYLVHRTATSKEE